MHDPFTQAEYAGGASSTVERRRRLRANLRLEVQFFKQDGIKPIRTRTENVSSEGFYCLAGGRFTPGERLECLITIPAMHPEDPTDALVLRCRVQVVRVELPAAGGFSGVGCRIEEYSVVHLSPTAVA